MKLLLAIALSILPRNILANPAKRAQTVQIQNLSASHFSNATIGTLQFSIQEPTANLSDDCSITWNTTSPIQPGLEPNKCLHGNFEFGFRYGIVNIENFALVVGRVNATEKGISVVSAYKIDPSWICTVDSEVRVGERCVWTGVLSIDVNTVVG